MDNLNGKVAWVTGAGTGIGEAVAVRFAQLGAKVVLTGRREQPLKAVAEKIGDAATVEPGDLSDSAATMQIANRIDQRLGRLDILVNNAGINVLNRAWPELTVDGVDDVVAANLSGPFYCVLAALPIMRRQNDGVLIHTASWAGRFVGRLAGPAYTATKHAVVAMSYSINLEEFQNGIRSTVVNPAEVATPIMEQRPVPVSAEDQAKMLQPEDMASTIAHVALAPAHVCINEIVISPTWNRAYLRQGGHGSPPAPTAG